MSKRVLMCAPTYFDVTYAINAWMDPSKPIDRDAAQQQWEHLYRIYADLGITVEMIAPQEELPDMTFATDNALVFGNKAALAHFLYPERQRETEHYEKWFKENGFETLFPQAPFEGGDIRIAGETLFIGYGFRTAKEAHAEIGKFFGKQVVSLHVTDKRFYHMDTAFCPLDEQTAMYFPAAFDEPSQKIIKDHFSNLIETSEADALAFGLNGFVSGKTAVISVHAQELIGKVKAAGFEVVESDISEFQKSGGGINCLTLELR